MAKSLSLPHGTVRVVDDVPGAFARAVHEAFAIRPEERFTLVASGGPTARRCYERLTTADGPSGSSAGSSRSAAGPSGSSGSAAGPSGSAAGETASPVDWRLVDVLMGDERCVAADDPEANQRLVREALLGKVGPVGSFHPMSCEDPAAYQRLLEDRPALDLVHLGLGPDGHTASLFPGSRALDAPAGVLVLRCSDPSGRNPHERMTLTFEAISRARTAVFTVAGESKREAFSALRAGADLPAARVRAREVVWLVDPAAAGEI